MSKTLSKYITDFDYFNKSLLVLSAASGGVSIALFVAVICAPVDITSANLSLVFSIGNGIVKKTFKKIIKKKKKHNIIDLLSRSKLNNIESITSKALCSSY